MQYINRRRETYFAYRGTTKTGKPKFFASKKTTSDKASRVESLPEYFEFYENPVNATVVIRRRRPTTLTASERNFLARLVLEYSSVDGNVVIEGNALVNKAQRLFSVSRYCCRSWKDGWLNLHARPSSLEDLAAIYLPHLGQDSYFELG
ncbi:hypothetical protein [Stieleria varia]|uniref:Uncharacterized protein n=1 Tax=Stieleria varia TaxID=2528005 RepID=A0A5C6A3M6_9BACT|nr:hypothetical protein [Stieleria varia]TWT94504.1 hypothetical protein Pla52n_53250 [Stieleria varia]